MVVIDCRLRLGCGGGSVVPLCSISCPLFPQIPESRKVGVIPINVPSHWGFSGGYYTDPDSAIWTLLVLSQRFDDILW